MGQQKTAAPVFSRVFRNLSQLDSIPNRHRLSVICQSVFVRSNRTATIWSNQTVSQTTDKRPTEKPEGRIGLDDFDKRLTLIKSGHDGAQFGFNAAQQLDTPRVADSNPHNRGTLAQESTNREILVFRDDDGRHACRVLANGLVRCRSKSTVGDVLGAMAERRKLPRERGRELSVDEEAQLRAPQDRMIVLPCGEFQNSRDVLGFQVRVVGKDLLVRRTRGEQIQDILHTNPKTANRRTTATNVRADRDSLDRAHVLTSGAL